MSHRSWLIFLSSLALAGGGNTPSAQTPKIQVQVYDYAGLRPAALHEFVARTQEVLDAARVAAQVKLCIGDHAVSCDTQTKNIKRLVIRLVAGQAKKMSDARRSPLGQSFAGHEGGTYASIFLERVQDAAVEANVPWVIVLAYVAVHEVGHPLLGSGSHGAGLDESELGSQ
jgi:hypothetical protein